MQYGVALSMEWLADLSAVKTAVVTADEEGFDFVTTSGHLLTASSGRYPQLPPFTYGLPYRDHLRAVLTPGRAHQPHLVPHRDPDPPDAADGRRRQSRRPI